MSLSNKTVVIVNGDLALGREIAATFLCQGANVAIHTCGDESEVKYASSLKPVTDRAVKVYRATLANQGSVKELFESVRADMGSVDVMVYNARAKGNNTAESLTLEALRHDVNEDLKPLFRCAKEVSKTMVAKHAGKIIPVYFGIGARGDADLTSWSACSGAIAGFVKCLAMEFLHFSINVNGVAYGYIEDADFPEELRQNIAQYVTYLKIPRAGKADDVAATVGFLASDGADYITGQNVYVNGGLLL